MACGIALAHIFLFFIFVLSMADGPTATRAAH